MKRVQQGRETRPCEKCGAGVNRKHSQFKEHTFCSRDCYLHSDYLMAQRAASNARRFVDRRAVHPCLRCGTDIERYVSQFNARTFCSKACERDYALANPTRRINEGGYVMLWVGMGYPGADKAGLIAEHRKVMQEHIGRPLAGFENVHHRNGDKQDNRLENLELWSRSQPSGQRVADKLAWARELIALYADVDI